MRPLRIVTLSVHHTDITAKFKINRITHSKIYKILNFLVNMHKLKFNLPLPMNRFLNPNNLNLTLLK